MPATPALVHDNLATLLADPVTVPAKNFNLVCGFDTVAGNTVIVWGYTNANNPVTSVIDDWDNTYTVHKSGQVSSGVGLFLASAPLTARLRISNQIYVFRATGAGEASVIAMEWSGVSSFVNASADTPFSGVSMAGGNATAAAAGELVLGLFYTTSAPATNSHAEITTPGSGFTNLNGISRDASSAGGTASVCLDQEYRVWSGSGSIAATATSGLAGSSGIGVTATFRPVGASVYSDLILGTSGLVSYWRLNESSGNALDSKGTNPGLIRGSGVTRAVTGLLSNEADKAVRGDGTVGTSVEVLNSASLQPTTQFTWECWVKLESFAATRCVLQRANSYIEEQASNAYNWSVSDVNNVATNVLSPTNALVIGQRQHLVGTYDAAGSMKLYVNGVPVGTQSRTPNANVQILGSPSLYMLSASGENGIVGTLDEVAYYNVALTPAQVLNHYNIGAGLAFDTPTGILVLSGTCAESYSSPVGFVKDIGSYGHTDTTSTPNPALITVPAGGVAAGNTVVIFGYVASALTGVTDSRGNKYEIRTTGVANVILVDGMITTPLLAGDTLQITRAGTPSDGGAVTLVAAEFNGLRAKGWFEALASAAFSATTAAAGGSRSNASPNGIVLGLFKINGSTTIQVATPGTGFTHLTGLVGKTGDTTTPAVDWEYKIGVANPVTAAATLSAPGTGSALTVVYADSTSTAPIVYSDACSGSIVLSGSTSETWRLPQSLIRIARELPRLRHHVSAVAPNGNSFRWGHDEPRAENILSGLRWSSTIPGGHENMDCVLPREPGVNYADLERLSTLSVIGPGGSVDGEFRLERTPQTSGDQMAISPSAVGWQAHLDDNKGASLIVIDRELGGWGSPSRARIVNLKAGGYNAVNGGGGSAVQDTTTGVPALDLSFDDPGGWTATSRPALEPLYDAGPGNFIGRLRFTWTAYGQIVLTDAQWSLIALLASTDTMTGNDQTTDPFNGAAASSGTVDLVATANRRFAALEFLYAVASATTATNNRYGMNISNLREFGNHGLTIRGSTPQTEGFFASDVVGYIVTKFAPMLKVTPDSIQVTNFIIQQLAFKESTTTSEMVKGSTRFGLEDWAVWNDKIFWLTPRNGMPMARKWRARIGPAKLEETGQQMDRLWESILVQYNDVDGSTRLVGPPGSGADVEDASLKDLDPENPANKLGIKRRDKLVMGTSTTAGAIQIGQRFLAEQKLIDRSGRASLVGYVEDDHGILWPYSEVKAGDQVTFVDAADTSYRRIVRADHDDGSKTASVDLDAPPEGLQAVLERLGVVLAPLGL